MRFNVPSYNPTPIESPQNALARGLELQRAQQGNALQRIQMEAFQAAQVQAAQERARQEQQRAMMEQWRRSIPSPQMQASQQALAGGGGPTVANAARMPAVDPRAQMIHEAFQMGAVDMPTLLKETAPAAPGRPLVVGDRVLSPDGKTVLYQPSGNVGKIGAISPESWTPESLAAYQRTGDPSVLKRYTAPSRAPAESPTALVEAGGADQLALSKRFGKPPAGYRWKADGSMEAVPGGPADIKAGAEGEKRAQKTQALQQQAESVLGTIADAKKLVGWTTAGPGGLAAVLPASSARDLQAKLTTIKANLGFDRLQQMRDLSPTGGALGQVAVQELVALQATVASLDQLQDPRELVKALDKIEGHYKRWQETLGGSTGGATGSWDSAPAKSGGGWKIERVN